MGLFEPHHLIVILVIALIIFGPGKIGDLGGTLGRGIRDFKKAMSEEPTPTVSDTKTVHQSEQIQGTTQVSAKLTESAVKEPA